ncbi:YmfL family putative regulatory protein [Pseudomonas fluorescens]
MKRPILATKRQVMSAVICAYPGGRECAAARLGYELKKFDNHIYENAGSRPLSDEQIHQLEQDAGTTHLPDYIAALYGGMFVPLAEPETLDNVELYSRSVKTAAKRGAVDQFIAKALENGEIDKGEAETILAAHRRYMSARHAEVLATILLHSQGAKR